MLSSDHGQNQSFSLNWHFVQINNSIKQKLNTMIHIIYCEDVKYLHRIFAHRITVTVFRFVFIVENIQPKYPVVFMSVVIF